MLEGWGRLLGHDANFLVTDPVGTFTKGGTALVVCSISIFADEQGAMEAHAMGPRPAIESGGRRHLDPQCE